MRRLKLSNRWLWLAAITLVGGWLRFYKLDWGEGYFFHPDEYHIAAAVERISFPSEMNPQLFSYGSFTIYLIYFSRLLLQLLGSQFLDLNSFLLGRFYSALFSTLTIVIVFFLAKELFKSKVFPLLSAFLVAITPGLIQQAHFTTPESILTFWLFTTLYFWLKWMAKGRLWLFLSAISLGLGLGTKVVALTFLAPLAAVFVAKLKPLSARKILQRLLIASIYLAVMAFTFFAVFPYSLLDWEDFRSSMNYETGVGRGDPLVFYTRQFIDTQPLVFQLNAILPLALGPVILVLGGFGFLFLVWEVISKFLKRRGVSLQLVVLALSFLAYFVPNALLFAKWTRFMAPTFPFWSIFSVYLLSRIGRVLENKKPLRRLAVVLTQFSVVLTLIWCLMFFSIYLKRDVRIRATDWINANLASEAVLLTEAGNMLEAPLWGDSEKIAFDFYHLEEEKELQDKLPQLLTNTDYFIIQSRRLFMDHQRLPNKFPKTARFYDLLFSGELGFEKIKEFDSYPRLSIGSWTLEVNDEAAEETWSVFDHPVVRIYKKTRPIETKAYAQLLEI